MWQTDGQHTVESVKRSKTDLAKKYDKVEKEIYCLELQSSKNKKNKKAVINK